MSNRPDSCCSFDSNLTSMLLLLLEASADDDKAAAAPAMLCCCNMAIYKATLVARKWAGADLGSLEHLSRSKGSRTTTKKI